MLIIGLILFFTSAGLHLGERAAYDKRQTLTQRSIHLSQTPSARHYAKLAQKWNQRWQELKGLQSIWGHPAPALVLLILGGTLYRSREERWTRRLLIIGHRPTKGRPRTGTPRSRPVAVLSRRKGSGPRHRPRRSLL